MARWLETLILLFGVLVAAGGIVAILLSGLDPLIGSAGLLAAVLSGALVWHFRRKHPLPETDKTIVTGRSVQKPPSGSESGEKFKGRI